MGGGRGGNYNSLCRNPLNKGEGVWKKNCLERTDRDRIEPGRRNRMVCKEKKKRSRKAFASCGVLGSKKNEGKLN